jgi:hypothetical protein
VTGVPAVLQIVIVKAHCSHNQKHEMESLSSNKSSYPGASLGAKRKIVPSLAFPKVPSQSGFAHLEII